MCVLGNKMWIRRHQLDCLFVFKTFALAILHRQHYHHPVSFKVSSTMSFNCETSVL